MRRCQRLPGCRRPAAALRCSVAHHTPHDAPRSTRRDWPSLALHRRSVSRTATSQWLSHLYATTASPASCTHATITTTGRCTSQRSGSVAITLPHAPPRPAWPVPVPAPRPPRCALNGDAVVCMAPGLVLSLNVTTASAVWKFPLASGNYSAVVPLLAGDGSAIITTPRETVTIDSTGAQAWTVPTPPAPLWCSHYFSPLLLDRAALFVGDTIVYAVLFNGVPVGQVEPRLPHCPDTSLTFLSAPAAGNGTWAMLIARANSTTAPCYGTWLLAIDHTSSISGRLSVAWHVPVHHGLGRRHCRRHSRLRHCAPASLPRRPV